MSDTTIAALELENCQINDLGPNTTGTCSVTNGDATVTLSSALNTKWSRRYGHQIAIEGVVYTIASTAENRLSVELTTPYAGAPDASADFVLYTAVDLAITCPITFIPFNDSQPFQGASVGGNQWYTRVTCTVKPSTTTGTLSLFIPSFVLPVTTDI